MSNKSEDFPTETRSEATKDVNSDKETHHKGYFSIIYISVKD